MTGISTGNRAVKGRSGRKLPTLEIPQTDNPGLARAMQNIAEHFRVYEGDGTAPKERFVTLRELEDAGLVKVGEKAGYGYISQVLNKDVSQKAGSTANPTLKGSIRKDTALGPRTPGGAGSASNQIEAGKRSRINKLNDVENVKTPSPAQADFLYYDGGVWKNYSLFKRENTWRKTQNFAAGIDATEILLDGVDITTLFAAGDFVEIDTLTQTDGYVYLNRTDATNPPFYVVQAGAGSVFRMGVGTVGSTTYSGAKFEMLNDGRLLLDAGAGEMFTLKNLDHAAGNTYNAWIQFDDNLDARQAFLGFGSSGNEKFYIWNDVGSFDFRDADGTGTEGFLFSSDATYTAVFENVATSSTDASIAIRGSRNNPSAATQPASLHFEQYDSDDGLDYEIARIAIEAQSTSTTHLDSSLMFMLRNSAGTLEDVVELHDTDTYLKGDLYIDGQTTGFLTAVTGTYGTIQTSGENGTGSTWGGFSVEGRGVLMWHPTEERGGIYDDVNNSWALQWNKDNDSSSEELSLYMRDGTTSRIAAVTQDCTASGISSGMRLLHPNLVYYDAGYNEMPRTITNASATLSNEDAGGYFYSNNSTTYTITLNNQTDFPVESCFFILNYGSGSVTIAPGTANLLWPNGSANSGTRTVGAYSVATILHYSANTWFIWGDSIS